MRILMCIFVLPISAQKTFELSPDEIAYIGNKIWHNECNNSVEKLIWWHPRESCISLGIGHFIWYPATIEQKCTQTFPRFIRHAQKKGIPVKEWLKASHCPWKSRADFVTQSNDSRRKELQDFLQSTIQEQAQFIIENFKEEWHKLEIGENCPKMAILNRFNSMASFPQGMYVLIDYANFKGFGINPQERYEGQGWGLLQVLQNMETGLDNKGTLKSFSRAAQKLLQTRVAHAPQNKPEDQFLPGWLSRIRSYEKF